MRLRSDLRADLIQNVGDDNMIAAAARVSTGHDLDAPSDPSGLIGYLMRNRHGSPFEHGSMTFRIEAPIFVAREFMRHRVGWSYNETSGRYRVLEPDFYLPGGDRPLEQVGKPGAYEFEPGSVAQLDMTREALEAAYASAWKAYKFILKQGVAKEVARDCLPVGLYTSWYATCNPRSLMHFLGLRTHGSGSAPLWEIEQVALGMEERFKELYPATWSAWDHNGRIAP